jgi:probable rRNA maturation factor
MKRTPAAALKIDVLVDSQRWKDPRAAGAVVRRAVRQAATALSIRPGELAIVLTDDAAMRRLNRNWRGIDAATNVLSFATRRGANRHKLDRASGHPGHLGKHFIGNHVLGKQLGANHLGANHFGANHFGANHLGDVVLAYETVKREARRDGKSFDHHLAHLAVHGFLHLLGYDHESDAQARRMESAERAILRDLAVPDPYCDPRSTAEQPAGRRQSAPPQTEQAAHGRRKIAAMLRPKMTNG